MNCMVHSTPMQKSTGKRFVAEPALMRTIPKQSGLQICQKKQKLIGGHIPAEKLLMPHVIISAVNEDVS